jgi:hypothetical protein
MALASEPGPLPAGTYVDTSTGPSVVFTVGDGWEMSGEPLEEVGTELQPGDMPAWITLTTFDGAVFASPCLPFEKFDALDDDAVAIDHTADAFISHLASHPLLTTSEPEPLVVAGFDAISIDISEVTSTCAEPEWALLWALPGVQEFHLTAGERARFIALDVEGEVVVLAFEALPDTDLDVFLDLATGLVDTLEITPADG